MHGRFAFTLLLCACLCGCGPGKVGPGRVAPDFKLSDMKGHRFYLSAHKGRVILLNFWSMHCVPCQKEMPELQKILETLGPKGLVVAGVCTDPERGYMEKLVKGLGLSYPILMDRGGDVARQYGIKAVPVTLIIDDQGIVRERVEGYAPGYAERYRRSIENLMAGKETHAP